MALVRKHSLTAGAIDALAVTDVHEDVVVTAVRNAGGHLQLIAWKVDGTLERTGDAVAGPVDDVSICHVGGRVATACRGASGKLTLTLWDVSVTGQLERTDVATAGTMQRAAPVGLGATLLATPLIDSEGNLKVIAWAVSDDGELTRRGEASGGRVTTIASDRWVDRRFVTAVRNARNDLELLHWVVRPDGKVERLAEVGAGTTGPLDVVRNHFVSSLEAAEFITAVRDADARIKLIAWEARADGSLRRLADLEGPPGTMPSLAYAGLARHAVAYRDAEGELHVQCFWWGAVSDPKNPGVPAGEAFELRESAGAGSASLVGLAGTASPGTLVTAVKNASGNLQVILWTLE